MDYVDLFNNISNFGILLVIAGIFLWDHINYKKKIQDNIEKQFTLLEEIKDNLSNIPNSLKKLETDIDEQSKSLASISNYCKRATKIQ